MEKIGITIVFQNAEDKKVFDDLLKRTSAMLSACAAFSDKVAECDLDKPMVVQLANPVERFAKTLISLYPYGPEQLQADIDSLGNFNDAGNFIHKKS